MKSAEAFVEVLERRLSPAEALHSLPDYEPRYIDRLSVEIYRAAPRNGWRFFPVSSSNHLTLRHANLFYAMYPPCSYVRNAWSNAVAVEASHE